MWCYDRRSWCFFWSWQQKSSCDLLRSLFGHQTEEQPSWTRPDRAVGRSKNPLASNNLVGIIFPQVGIGYKWSAKIWVGRTPPFLLPPVPTALDQPSDVWTSSLLCGLGAPPTSRRRIAAPQQKADSVWSTTITPHYHSRGIVRYYIYILSDQTGLNKPLRRPNKNKIPWGPNF